MTDQGMLSLFGEEGPLFSEGLGDLGECSYPDGQQMVMEQGYGSLQQNLRELGQFHHYGQYEQPGGATLGSQQYHPSGPPQAPPSGPPMSQQHAGYQNMQAERQGQSFMGGSNMWGPGATPSPAPRPHAPLQPMGVYSAGVRGEYSQQNLPRGGPPPPSRFAGHVGPQQGSRMAGPPMHHPVQQQQQQRPRHHPAPGQFHPETVPHGRCFSPNTQPHPLHQPNMGFSPHGQPVPLSVPNGSARFPSYPSPNQGSAAAVGAGPNAMQAQGYAGASDFLPLGGPQGPVPHQQPLHGPQMGPAHSHQQQLQAPPPQMSYRSGSPMSPMKAVTNPTGPPAAPPQQGVAMGTGMEVGGYPGVPVQPPGAAGVSQTQQPLPPQPYRGMPQCQSSHNPLQQGQGMPFHQLPPTPLSQPHMTPPSHQQPWTQPHPLLPVTHKVPVSQPSPLDPSPETYPKLRPAANSGTQPLTSDPGDAHQKPKKKKQKKKKEKEKSEEEAEEKGEPATVNGPEQEVSSGAKKKKTKAKDPGTPKSPKTHKSPKTPKTPKSPKTPKTPKSPKTPKTPKEPKEKKVKTPKNGSATKPSIKKTSPETDTVAKKEVKRKRESSDHSDEEERIPPASPEEEEEDGGTQKRRSSRQVKRKRYTEELDFRISDDEGERREGGKRAAQSDQAAGADGPIVEKIMAVRQVKKENAGGEEVEVEEFYVKFKALSYLHCRWADMEELEKDKRIQQKVKRFKAKQSLNSFLSEMDEEPFNPDYVEVDRILDVSEGTDENGEPLTHYLVKWCSLPYEDSTWELQADVDPGKIQEFQRLMEREPELERVERPPADEWQELKTSREYQNSNGLREYQLEGVNWLLFNWYNTRNCILADEMGLGKTIQSITFLYEMFLKGVHGPFLVIAPLSTIPNWDREFRTWTNLNVVVYHGSQASRKTIQAYEMNFRDEQGAVIKGAYKFHALITTFEMILTDCPELRSVGWRCVVIDEAHRLKNRNCKLLEGLKMMDMEHKVLLTGTPLQNTVEELFSLLNFLEPLRFPSEATFMQEFGDLKTEEQVQQLQAILKPMMLRRLKEDVEKNLAPKEETIIEVELTNVQKKYYRAILEKNFAFLSKGGPGAGGGGNGNVPNLLNTMMELRKCCNHPYLITGAEEKIVEEFRETHPCEGPELALQAMVQAAGKLVLIDKLLPKLKAGGHRVLIFSQMVRCLDILEDYLIQKRYSYERIDGRVRGNLRQAAIDRFSRPDSDRFVFLLCTRAGGLGINLTAADTCVIFDSDWNPQNDLQAQARCHRIGQSKAVKIYRLITRNSYEREMFDKASLKLGLDKAVLQSMSGRENVANGVQQLSKKEIEDLLRKGAYGALMETEDEGSKFCEEDIDQILQRRTQTITIECDGKGSTFAKASFVSSGNRTDISLEDPDFWQKWAKKAELDMSVINRRNTLVIDTPRVRKQTRHFSAAKEDELLEFSELESDSEDPPTPRTRRPQDRAHGYPRSACFRVEKNLLLGRWGDILSRGRFKRPLTLRDVETICRALLVYCVQHYRGDENIKSFIWDLITPTEDGRTRDLLNHSGLSAPVPRGRKGKKGKAQGVQPFLHQADWLASCNPNTLLQEDSYKKHLKHHCNKVLLRVRMLYYLKQEVIGSQADKILEGADSSEIDIWIPQPFLAEMPCDWWDREADKSLLIGVFKHGYEKYNSMRADPALHFLEKVGLPDPKAIAAEQGGADLATDGTEGGDLDREDEDPEYRPARMAFKEEMEECTNSSMGEEEALGAESLGPRPSDGGSQGKLRWPSTSALTGRLRRLIAAYQRSHKREQQRQEALLMIQAHRHHPQGTAWPMAPQREAPVPDRRQRWTRREEADFYRVVSTFGVLRDGQRFDWRHFRTFARLDRRTDHHLEGYFLSFVAMCRRVCHLPLRPEDETLDPTVWVEPITAERASRTMYRIELLRRIREQVLPHPGLAEGLRLCQPSPDLPEWWECGRHDRDLLLGASKHGLSRTDYHIFNDPELGFLEAHRKFSHPPAPAPKDQQTAPKPLPQKTEDGCDRVEGKAEAGSPKEEEHREEGATSLRGEPGSEGEEAQLKAEEEEKQQAGLKAEAEQMDPSPEGKEAELKSEGEKTEPKAEGQEAEPKAESKPLSEKGSEEDDEDKMEEDYKSESSQAEASAASKAFDEESNASLSTALDETRDGFPAEDAPVVCDRSFSFFHWPKDRVVIDRLDVICETVLKGKWPANRRQLFEFPAPQLPGYGPAAATGSPATRGFGELAAAGQASGSEETTLAPQDESESVSAPFLPSQRRGWRRAEAEAERVAKRRHLMDMVAQLRESHGHAHAGGQSTSHASPAFSLPASSAPCDARSSRAESPSGTPPNGAFTEDELPMKRRRGRRRNVEGLDLLFARHRKEARNPEDSEMTKAFLDGVQMPAQAQRNIASLAGQDPKNRGALDNLVDRNGILAGGALGNKNLAEWLGRHPSYASDTPSYSPKREELPLSPFPTPKQKRHRCRNPSKIDVNTLTGDERVPVVNRRSGRKLGGSFAPPMRDLPRWLKENPEFAVSPDWTDIVKQSGFLPESMFGGLLTGPVVREEGVCRRGRRPKSEGVRGPAPVAATPPAGLNPLLMGGLMGGLQSLQLAGLMGFPSGDPKQAAALLPLMLPNMLSLGGLFGNLATTAGSAPAGQGEPDAPATPKKEKEEEEEEDEEGEGEREVEEEKPEAEGGAAASASAISAAMASMSTNALAFNPFLLSAMAPGLFYPSMFLPPGLSNLGNLGNLPGNLSNLGNLPGNLSNLGNLGNLANLGNLGYLSNLGNLGNLGLSGLPQALAGLQSAMAGASVESAVENGTDECSGSGAENDTGSSTENSPGAGTGDPAGSSTGNVADSSTGDDCVNDAGVGAGDEEEVPPQPEPDSTAEASGDHSAD